MNFLEENLILILILDAHTDSLACLCLCPSAPMAPCPLLQWHASISGACEPTKMNCFDGIHYSVILINFELMNLHEIMLTKYSQNNVSENKIYFDLEVYHRCFRLLLRIVSVYYGSNDQFSFHKILNSREKRMQQFSCGRL